MASGGEAARVDLSRPTLGALQREGCACRRRMRRGAPLPSAPGPLKTWCVTACASPPPCVRESATRRQDTMAEVIASGVAARAAWKAVAAMAAEGGLPLLPLPLPLPLLRCRENSL